MVHEVLSLFSFKPTVGWAALAVALQGAGAFAQPPGPVDVVSPSDSVVPDDSDLDIAITGPLDNIDPRPDSNEGPDIDDSAGRVESPNRTIELPMLPETEVIGSGGSQTAPQVVPPTVLATPGINSGSTVPTPAPTATPVQSTPVASANAAGPTLGNPAIPVPAQSLAPVGGGSIQTAAQNFPGSPLPSDSVVTAARQLQSAGNVGGSLTVISGETLRQSQQFDVSEVLRSVPGLDVSRSGGPGQLTSVFLRGANSNQTKVLLDGLPINDPGSAGRAFDFSFLSVDNIERIEVLRGPQSTLYGSDAIGGVVNIITARGSGPPTTSVSALGGKFGTARQAFRSSGGNDQAYYSIAGSYLDTDGFSAASRPPGNVEDDFYRNGTLSGRFGYNVTENLNVDVVTRYNDTDTGLDFGFGLPQDDDSSLEQENTFARVLATWQSDDGSWTHRVSGGYTQYDRFSFNPFGGRFYGRQGRFSWQNDLVLMDTRPVRMVATSGVDYLEELARNDTILDQNQDNLGGFALLNLSLGRRIDASVGGRWDDYTFFGDTFTYRTTANLNVFETGTVVHGAIGTGFRAPALAELFDPFVGSLGLAPETSKGWEAGVRQSLDEGRLFVDATYFRNDFSNLIQFDFGTFSLENVGVALASGVELSTLYRATDRTTLFANWTFTDTRNFAAGTQLLRRPRDKVSFGWRRNFARRRGNYGLIANYVGERLDTGGAFAENYWRVDVSGAYQVNRNLRAIGRIDNLFDDPYEEVLGFNGTRFAAFAGAEYRLGGSRRRRSR